MVTFGRGTALSRQRKSILLVFIAFFFLFGGSEGLLLSPATAQEQLARLPALNLHGVFFLDKDEGWAVGRLGGIFHTTDRGKGWEAQQSGVSTLLTAVNFADSTHGWVVGEGGVILHTQDGGSTWKQQQSGFEARADLSTATETIGPRLKKGVVTSHLGNLPLFDVAFIDRNTGWVVGHLGAILFTQDGGRHWVDRSLSLRLEERGRVIQAVALQDVVDPRTGEIVARAGQLLDDLLIAEIRQSGVRDVRVREDTVLNAVFFLDQAHGWIGGEHGLVLRTQDAGKTWERAVLPRHPMHEQETVDAEFSAEELEAFGVEVPSPSVYGLCFVSPLRGWAVGQDGTIAYTQDGGRQWEFQPIDVQRALYGVHVIGDRGWIVGDRGTVLVSTDGGMGWEQVELDPEYRLSWIRRLSVVPGNHSFLVGAYGLFLVSGSSPDEGVWIRRPDER